MSTNLPIVPRAPQQSQARSDSSLSPRRTEERVSQNTRIRLTLHPDQDGAKALRAEYGERSVCVRYRYDVQNRKRYKTVELVIAEGTWTPIAPIPAPGRVVAIRVGATELEVRRQAKSAGGQWNAQRGVWKLRYDRVVALGLHPREVEANSE
jgi:hypothetical protein